MRIYPSETSSVSVPVLGIVTRNESYSGFRSGHVLVIDQHPGDQTGYAGVVCRSPRPSSVAGKPGRPIVWGLTDADQLSEGDIIRIGQNGSVSVLQVAGSTETTVFLTNRCNANCGFCPQPQMAGDCFLPGEVGAFIQLLNKDTEVVGITGGEPTLARNALVEVIRACRLHLPRARIDLLTNGILLADEEFVGELAEIGGRSVVFEIPIHSDVSLEHDRFIGVQGFEATIRAILNLARHRQKVAIRTVIHRQNFERLPQLAEFIARNLPFAFHVALMGLEVIHRARANVAMYWIDPFEYVIELEEAARILKRADMAISIYNLPLCVLPTSLWGLSRKSISLWKRGYMPSCEMCCVRELCGGVFLTSREYQSHYLRPVGDRCDFAWPKNVPDSNYERFMKESSLSAGRIRLIQGTGPTGA